jgi:hypothetical protein
MGTGEEINVPPPARLGIASLPGLAWPQWWCYGGIWVIFR